MERARSVPHSPASSVITRLHKRIIELDVPANVIAEKAGIKQTRLSEYRHSRRKMPMGHVMVLCEVLACEPEEIMGTVEVDEVSTHG